MALKSEALRECHRVADAYGEPTTLIRSKASGEFFCLSPFLAEVAGVPEGYRAIETIHPKAGEKGETLWDP